MGLSNAISSYVVSFLKKTFVKKAFLKKAFFLQSIKTLKIQYSKSAGAEKWAAMLAHWQLNVRTAQRPQA